MKKFLIILIVVLTFHARGFSQESNIEPIYSSVGIEKQPEFPGGFKEFGNYVQRNYKYPNVPFLKGQVFVEFVIEKDGSVAGIRVIRDIGYGTGEEA
ncbi:energy transducer TonB [Flavobacterium sp.]|uniref:energy transducer TonB n=1 Tax=Flavobacterium sp. TaxID=239 RepID=UPI00374FF336